MIEAAALIRNLQQRVRRLETLEQEGCFQLIESQTGATFTTISIPDIYKHLYMVYSASALVSPPGDTIGIRFNGDSGSNYNWIRRLVTDATETTITDGGSAIAGGSTYANIGQEGRTTIVHSPGFCLMPDYLNTTKQQSWVAECHTMTLSPFSYQLFKVGGRWINTAAIFSIDIIGTYYSNSTFSLYGLC